MSGTRLRRAHGGLAGVLAIMAVVFSSGAGHAADMNGPAGYKDAPDGVEDQSKARKPAAIPAGVLGATMFRQGETAVAYLPVFVHLQGNYMGTNQVSPATVLSIPNINTPPAKLRIVPNEQNVQIHRFSVTYGVSDAFNLSVLGSYIQKEATRTTYNPLGTSVVGTRTDSIDGIGDLSVSGFFRLYQDAVHHVHLNLGVSLPTGSTTEEWTGLAPNGSLNVARTTYGMMPGTGTVDLLPGVTYTARKALWSWGATYRGRIAMEDNDQGYRWGNLHEVSGWAGYTLIPGVTATARVVGTVQGQIEGRDLQIKSPAQGANPAFYGGERVDLLAGVEVLGKPFGLGNTRFAVEAGPPVYQNVNGPQLGRDWQVNVALGMRF